MTVICPPQIISPLEERATTTTRNMGLVCQASIQNNIEQQLFMNLFFIFFLYFSLLINIKTFSLFISHQ
jgi:hypothetical protein